jgi:hypothetical protein
MLFSFTGLTKVLVTTGQDRETTKIEIIDLNDPLNVWQPSHRNWLLTTQLMQLDMLLEVY